MKRYTVVWEQKNPRIIEPPKQVKTIKAKKTKTADCPNCEK
jgi:hypothetical protein